MTQIFYQAERLQDAVEIQLAQRAAQQGNEEGNDSSMFEQMHGGNKYTRDIVLEPSTWIPKGKEMEHESVMRNVMSK